MRLLLAVYVLLLAQTQSVEPKLTFEVASVKPYSPKQPGASGRSDPGRLVLNRVTLADLILSSYSLKSYQLIGPDWLSSELFDVVAKAPEGTTKEQQSIMLQNLLAERFHLTLHRETKEMPVYEMVLAERSPKFQRTAPPSEPPPASVAAPGPPRYPIDADGFPVLPPSGGSVSMMSNGRMLNVLHRQLTMASLAAAVAGQAGRPVVDRTGLEGQYDIALHWAWTRPIPKAASVDDIVAPATDVNSPPDIFTALRLQLGLKLESKRGSIEVTVVDHAEKVPTEN